MEIGIRPIEPRDNAGIALIIRTALEEFGANKAGTVYFDASTDNLFDLFENQSGSAYFVAEADGQLLGGAGIFPTEGLPKGTCELVKMYLSKDARGKGLGQKMISHVMQWAKDNGYSTVYLETMPELAKAVKVYEQFGFQYLNGPMGNSGHCGCDIWMSKSL